MLCPRTNLRQAQGDKSFSPYLAVMKFRICIAALLILTSYLHVAAQKANRPLHEIIFFRMVNNQNTVTQQLVRIGADGNVYDGNRKLVASFDIKQTAKEVNDYIMKEKIEKDEANNNPPPEAMTPELNQQSIHITVWFKDDVDKEKEFMNKTNYHWGRLQEKDKTNYPIYKYLSEKEASVLKELLK